MPVWLIYLQYAEAVIKLVQNISSMLPPDTPGKAKADEIINILSIGDSKVQAHKDQISGLIEWAYQKWVKPKEDATAALAATVTTVVASAAQ